MMVVLGMMSAPTTTETQNSLDFSAAERFRRPPTNKYSVSETDLIQSSRELVPQIELIQSIGDYGFIFYKVFGTKYRSVGRFRYLKLIRHKWQRLSQNPSLIITHLNTNEPVSVDVANSKLSGSEFLRFLNQITTMLIREFVANSNFMAFM